MLLARRDLFDARFQLISESDVDHEIEGEPVMDDRETSSTTGARSSSSTLSFLDTPSDLLPGLYEGGLKTWECSIDLVYCLDSLKNSGRRVDVSGTRVLEVRTL